MLTRLVFLALMAWALFTLFFGLAYATIHAALAHDGIHDAWFAAQLVPPGNANAGMSCCDHSDGHVLEEDDWRIADGHYEFRWGASWVVIADTRVLPYDGANPSHPEAAGNPIGKPVVWYIVTHDGEIPTPHVYCFKAGTES